MHKVKRCKIKSTTQLKFPKEKSMQTLINENISEISKALNLILNGNFEGCYTSIFINAKEICQLGHSVDLEYDIKHSLKKFADSISLKISEIVSNAEKKTILNLISITQKIDEKLNFISNLFGFLTKNRLCLPKLSDFFFLKLKENLTRSDLTLQKFLNLANEIAILFRSGQIENFDLIKIEQCFSRLGLNFVFYGKEFQNLTEEYFEKQGELTEKMEIVEHLKFIENSIFKERKFAIICIKSDSREKHLKLVKLKLIENRAKEIVAKGFFKLVKEGDFVHLQILYKFLFSVEMHFLMAKVLQEYVESEIRNAFFSNKENEMIQILVDFSKSTEDMIKNWLFSDSNIRNKSHKAFESVLNTKNCKLAQLIAIEFDKLIKNEKIEPDKICKSKFENILHVFKYLSRRDVFELHYRIKLIQRKLSSKTNAKENKEILAISALEKHCGNLYIYNIKAIQAETESKINSICHSGPPLVNLKIFNKTNWPSCAVEFEEPNFIRSAIEKLKKEYIEKTERKKLSKTGYFGNVRLKINFLKRPVTLIMSPFQAAILMLFNEKNNICCGEIFDILFKNKQNEKKMEILKSNLKFLTEIESKLNEKNTKNDKNEKNNKRGILIKNSANTSIKKEDRFSVNFDAEFDEMENIFFLSDLIFDNLSTTIENEKNTDLENISFKMDSVIVRALKRSKSMNKNDLFLFVKEKMKEFDEIDSDIFERRIIHLKSRGFLRYGKNDSVLEYLP